MKWIGIQIQSSTGHFRCKFLLFWHHFHILVFVFPPNKRSRQCSTLCRGMLGRNWEESLLCKEYLRIHSTFCFLAQKTTQIRWDQVQFHAIKLYWWAPYSVIIWSVFQILYWWMNTPDGEWWKSHLSYHTVTNCCNHSKSWRRSICICKVWILCRESMSMQPDVSACHFVLFCDTFDLVSSLFWSQQLLFCQHKWHLYSHAWHEERTPSRYWSAAQSDLHTSMSQQW